MNLRAQIAAGLAVAAVALTGCGGGSDDTPPRPAGRADGTHASGSTSTGRSHGRPKGTSNGSPAPGASGSSGSLENGGRSRFPGIYSETVRICSQASRNRVAHDFGVEKASPSAREIAEAVARGYKPRYRKKAFEGCSDGLALTGAS
jgi:hypothetical protein